MSIEENQPTFLYKYAISQTQSSVPTQFNQPMKKVRVIILSIGLAVQLFKFFIVLLQRRKIGKIAAVLKTLQPLTPTQIIEKMSKQKLRQSLQLCLGVVRTAEPVFSFLKPNLPILRGELFKGDALSNIKSRLFLNNKEASHYIIQDRQNKIRIFQIHQMIHDYTKIIRKIEESLAKKIKNYFYGRVVTPKKKTVKPKLYSDIQNAFQIYIPNEKVYSVLANFVKEQNQVCTYKPIIIAKEPNRMRNFFEDSLLKKEIVLTGLFTGMIVCFAVLFHQIWIFNKETKLKRQQQTITKANTIVVKSRMCSICKNKLSCIFNKPCNHMSICNECWLHDSNCIECKKKIGQQIEYFVC